MIKLISDETSEGMQIHEKLIFHEHLVSLFSYACIQHVILTPMDNLSSSRNC